MKRIMAGIIILVYSLSIGFVSFANENVLTLDEVLTEAVGTSKQLKIDDINIKNSRKVLETAIDDADNINMTSEENSKWDVADPDEAYITSKRKIKELTPEQREYDVDYYRNIRIADELKIKVDVYDTYYALVKVKKDIDYKMANLDLVNEKLKVSKLKYEKGLISKNDFELMKFDVEDAKINLSLAQRSQNKYLTKLYTLMGLGYHPDIKNVEETLEYKEIEFNVDDATKAALTNRMEIIDANANLDLSQMEFDIVDMYYEDDELEYASAQNKLEVAKYKVKTDENDVEYEIRSAYNELLNMQDTIKINKNEASKKQILCFVGKLKYNLKMITTLELNELELDSKKAELNVDNSIIDFNISKFKFSIAKELGTGMQKSTSTSTM